ncbi:MAG: hypothetical protein GY894_02185 [Planctomycetes bacterium]|jgi:hypothetical protein|nr:hypothetical protein [Planctomycetota bacterium]MCP4838159.1 hypothetical protein [Planctomycetota bacterium]
MAQNTQYEMTRRCVGFCLLTAIIIGEVPAVAGSGTPTGACCFREYDWCMNNLTETECQQNGGQYQGDDISCSTIECEYFGACCVIGDNNIAYCIDTNSAEECFNSHGGTYQGDGTTCDNTTCDSVGACCAYDDYGYGDCYELTEEECYEMDGLGYYSNYLGDGTTCEEVNYCAAPTGACCLDDGNGGIVCEQYSFDECADNAGDNFEEAWGGSNTTCDDGGCNLESTCTGDIDGDFTVSVNDITALLGAWGSHEGSADIDQSGTVDLSDLLMLLGHWGPCP